MIGAIFVDVKKLSDHGIYRADTQKTLVVTGERYYNVCNEDLVCQGS